MDNIADLPQVHNEQRRSDFSSYLTVKRLDPKAMSGDEMNHLWQRIATQDYAFDDNTKGDPRAFVLNLTAPASFHFQVNDSAYVLLRNVWQDSDCHIHFILWDRNFPFRDIIEAGRQIIDWAFKDQKVHRISGYIPKFNALAIRFASTMGFKYEGTLREAIKFNQTFHDVDVYGILEKQFERRFQS